MTEQTLADLVNDAMAKKFRPDGKPWVDDTLSRAIGLLPGDKGFDAKQVWRLRRGERRSLSRELVARLIEVLGLDPDEAWAAAGLLPPEVRAEDLRQMRRFRAAVAAPASPGRGADSCGYPNVAGVAAARQPRDRRRGARRRRGPVPAELGRAAA